MPHTLALSLLESLSQVLYSEFLNDVQLCVGVLKCSLM